MASIESNTLGMYAFLPRGSRERGGAHALSSTPRTRTVTIPVRKNQIQIQIQI